MSAPSQTRTCNAALAHLGESRRILALNEGTPLAKIFEQTWDEAVEEVLVDHPWNFAVKRQAVAASADEVPAGSQYSQAFEKPADCLRWLPWRSDHADYFSGEEEGRFILSNADAPLIVRYIANEPDVARWSAGFRAALAAKLAFKNAKAITGQTAMIDLMADIYDEALRKAKRQDGSATGDRARGLEFRSDWLGARRRTYGGSQGL